VTTADTYVLLLSTTISNDICKVIWPKLTSPQLLLISRLTTVIGGALAIVLALYGQSVFLLFRMGSAAYGAGMFVPLVLACYWKGVRAVGVNWGMCAGCATTIIWNFVLRPGTGIEGVIPGAIACLILTVAVSLFAGKDDGTRLAA
jgi:sodium/proline symporter